MTRGISALFVLAPLLLATSIWAEEPANVATDQQAKANDWRLVISPYALLASQSTDVGGEKIRQSFNDLSSMTDFGFQLVTTVMYKRWLLRADGTYANLGTSSQEPLLGTDLDIKQYMLDLRLGYLAHIDVDLEDESGVVRGWLLEINAGAKYWRNDVTLDYRIGASDGPPLLQDRYEALQSWWDMMLGVNARIVLSRSVLLSIQASGGGFGIGTSSKFSWDFVYLNTFRVSRLISVTAGFRSFRYDRVDDDVETTVNVLGPLIGVSFVI